MSSMGTMFKAGAWMTTAALLMLAAFEPVSLSPAQAGTEAGALARSGARTVHAALR